VPFACPPTPNFSYFQEFRRTLDDNLNWGKEKEMMYVCVCMCVCAHALKFEMHQCVHDLDTLISNCYVIARMFVTNMKLSCNNQIICFFAKLALEVK
jgi:hypothetical protein